MDVEECLYTSSAPSTPGAARGASTFSSLLGTCLRRVKRAPRGALQCFPPGAVPSVRCLLSSRSQRLVLCLPQVQAQTHAIPFDIGFVERNAIHDQTSPGRRSTLKNIRRDFDPSTLPSCEAFTLSPLAAIAALTQIRARYAFPCKIGRATASANVSFERYRAAVERGPFDTHKENRKCSSYGLFYLTKETQPNLGIRSLTSWHGTTSSIFLVSSMQRTNCCARILP